MNASVVRIVAASLAVMVSVAACGTATRLAPSSGFGASTPSPPVATPSPPVATPSPPVAGVVPAPATMGVARGSGRPSQAPVPPAPAVAADHGTIGQFQLPAPWVGGASSWANVGVYAPPGYAGSPVRFPVIYEVPWGSDGWQTGVGIESLLDRLMGQGSVAPAIVVFVNQARGPYRPSECADSWDGREWFDAYVARTVVPWVDAHFRTIADPGSRTLMGFSQGGYCATTLLLHHPDTFGSAISFSGYYQAGVVSPETRMAWRPFGGVATLIAADSPLVLGRAPTLGVTARSGQHRSGHRVILASLE